MHRNQYLAALCAVIGGLSLVGCGSDNASTDVTPGADSSVDTGTVDTATDDTGSNIPDTADTAPTCKATETACDGKCVDTSTNRDNCSACGKICEGAKVCVAGVCVTECPTGQKLCGTVCASTDTDTANCGACGKACAAGEVCSAGACGLSCGAPLITCTPSSGGSDAGADATPDASTDATTDASTDASDEAGAETGADGGASSYCANPNTDRLNCGGCGNVCPTGNICVDGSCTLVCGGGTSVCSGSCRDFNTDPANCGSCGHACAAGEICNAGTCALSCAGGTSLCSGVCRDLNADPSNCGMCGKTCAAGEVCSGGSCSLACGGGTVKCTSGTTSICTNLASDPNNCSSCGAACPARANATSVCAASACSFVCTSGHGDCNATASDGCEATFASDNNNCGKCGNVCAAGKVCRTGVCTTVGTVLIYHESGDTLADDAVTALGGTPNLTTNGTAFNTAFDAGGYTAIIWDSPGSDMPSGTDTRLATWIAGGGRLVYSFWHLKSNPTMAAALGVNTTVEFSTFRPVYVDATTVNFWTYYQTFPSPLTGTDQAGINGDELTLTGAGFIAGRFDSATGPGAIAVTHAGRVIVDGFLPWDTRAIDNDGDGIKDMNEMFQNQLLYVLKN